MANSPASKPINDMQSFEESPAKSACVCPAAGWCATHGLTMTGRQHRQCREKPAFFGIFQRLGKQEKPRPQGPPNPRSKARRQPQGPPKPCGGCDGRKKKMNAILPGSGDLVEKVTTKTGIKDWWERRLARKDYTPPATCAVVIPCHNYGRFLGEAIESVLNQSQPADEILVVLDHCSDDSREVAERYKERIKIAETHACDLHLVRRFGSRNTTSDVVIFLDADDKLPPDYIETGMKGFADPRVGIVTGDVYQFGNDDTKWTVKIGDIEKQNCATSACLVRRDAFEHSQCFEDLSLIDAWAEDWQAWKRIVRAGWKVAKANIVHHHRRHSDNMTLGDKYAHEPEYKRQRTLAEYKPGGKIKIGFVAPLLDVGGVESLTLSQIEYAKSLDWIGIYIKPGGTRNPAVVEKFSKLYDDLEELTNDADIIYAVGPADLVNDIKACTNKPIVYGVHSTGKISVERVASFAGKVDLFYCVSQKAIDIVPAKHRHKATLIRGGADARITHCERDRNEIRREWGVGEKQLAVGYIGRLSPEKNPAVIAQAVRLIPNAKFICCSPQSANENHPIRRDIKDALPGRAAWTGADKQPIGEVYKGLDCLVVASHEEGMPLVTLEAWAAGVPVVSTPVGLLLDLEPTHGKLVERVPLNPTAKNIISAINKAIRANPRRHETAKELVLYSLGAKRAAAEFESSIKAALANNIKPFVVRSFPRSGTNMLQSAIDSHPELACHGEVFTSAANGTRFKGWTTRELYYNHTGPGMGLVIQGWAQNYPPEGYPSCKEVWDIISCEKPTVIVLYRRDQLRRAASIVAALQSQIWISRKPTKTGSPPVTIEPDKLALYIRNAEKSLNEARELYPDAHYIAYEDLVADWDNQIARIQRAIGVREVLPLKPATYKQGSDRPIREVIANYNELRDHFAGTEFERWFETAESRNA